MNNFFDTIYLDNTIRVYLELLFVILISLIVKRLISIYLAGLLFKAFSWHDKNLRKRSFVELVINPLEYFLMIVIIIIAFDKLIFPSAFEFTLYKINSRNIIDGVAHTALIISFIRLCIRLVQFAALVLEEKANTTTDQSDNQLVSFFKDFFRVVLNLLAFLLILRFVFGYDISKLVTGLSIVGAAIALATKESLENLIASFIIFFDKPFTIGDIIKIQNYTGTVEKIGLRSTRLRTDHKTYVTVPNKQMVDSILDNISLRTERRAEVILELSLNVSAKNLKIVIEEIKKVLKKENIESASVFLSNTGKNANIITVEFFCDVIQSINEFNSLREQINLEIINLINENNIEMAGNKPTIVVTQE